MRCTIFVLSFINLVVVSFCDSYQKDEPKRSDVKKLTAKSLLDCLSDNDVWCAEVNILGNLNRMLQKRSLQIMDGVYIEKRTKDTEAATGRSLEGAEGDVSVLGTVGKLFQELSMKVEVFPGINARLSGGRKQNQLYEVTVETDDKGIAEHGTARAQSPIMMMLGGVVKMIMVGVAMAAMKMLSSPVRNISLILAVVNGLKKLFGPKTPYNQYPYYGGQSYNNVVYGRANGGNEFDFSEPQYEGSGQNR